MPSRLFGACVRLVSAAEGLSKLGAAAAFMSIQQPLISLTSGAFLALQSVSIDQA